MPLSLMRIDQVCAVIGYKKPTIYQWIREGKFPRPIKIGRSARWPSDVVDSWINDRINENKNYGWIACQASSSLDELQLLTTTTCWNGFHQSCAFFFMDSRNSRARIGRESRRLLA